MSDEREKNRVRANGVLIWADGTVEPRDGLCGHTYIILEPGPQVGHVDDIRLVDVERVLAGKPSKPPPPFKDRRFRLITAEHGVAIYVELPRIDIDGMVVER